MAEDGFLPRWPDMSAAERAVAYSPSVMVGGDLSPFIEAYVAQSAAAYVAAPKVHQLSYGTRASQSLDLVLPQQGTDHPLHVFIHGGYWQELSKKESFFPAPGTLAMGMGFAALDYTLAPHATLDQIVAEVTAALRHLRTQAAGLGIDPERIVVSGSSAGAHLAAMACLELDQAEQPAGVVLLSGIYDLRPLLETYVNDALGMDAQTAQRNSPALRPLHSFPPCQVAWAERDTDEFKRQSRQFAQLLETAGCDVQMMEVAGRNHFDIVHDLTSDSALGRALMRLSQAKDT